MFDAVHKTPRLAARGNEVIPAARDVGLGVEAQYALPHWIAVVVIVEEPAIETGFAESGLHFIELHAGNHKGSGGSQDQGSACRPLLRYSQRGMATVPNRPAAGKSAQQGFVYLPLIAGWLVPGAGHFLLHKWIRGTLLSASIILMFALGLVMHGKLYTGAQDILDILGLIGDLGNGAMYFVGHILGLGADPVQVTTADYGSKFIVVAGLLNVIAAVDAHNLRTGRKES